MSRFKNSLSSSNFPVYEEMKSYESHNNEVFVPCKSNIFKLLKIYQHINYSALSLPEKIEVDRDGDLGIKWTVFRKVTNFLKPSGFIFHSTL